MDEHARGAPCGIGNERPAPPSFGARLGCDSSCVTFDDAPSPGGLRGESRNAAQNQIEVGNRETGNGNRRGHGKGRSGSFTVFPFPFPAQVASTIIAVASPPPMQMAATPIFFPLRKAWMSVVRIRAPEAPIG